ncbi:MAG TPA: DUF5317 domain-containing protein [Actinomycetota bacterium]|nr:DUF5317 domain-containing protein [Actinomycetota bacterium]
MKLVALSLAIALAAGALRGGRVSALSDLRIRFAPLALVAFAMQLVNPPGRWPLVLLLGSFVLLSIVAVVNLRTPGFALVLVGLAMNLAVVAVNGGMPVDREAIVASGQLDTLEGLVQQRAVKHHLAGPADRLRFLADEIALPPPVAQVVSLGDVFTYGGVGAIVAAGMRRRRTPQLVPIGEARRVQV